MAGIGFVLRRLVEKDDLLGVLRAYTHSAMASTGPWLFTVLALGGIAMLYRDFFAADQLLNFRVVTIYNFAFSLVLSAPVFMVVTRYLADSIHRHDVTETPSVMLGSLIILYAIQLPIAGLFYLVYVDLELSMRISALINVFLITTVWLLGVFMMALKDYNAVTRAFGIGMIIAVVMSDLLKDHYRDVGMVNGFSMGLAFIVFSLVARIMAEYPYRFSQPFAMKPYFRRYWELAVGGIFYNAAIWVDKWIMWFAPERMELPSKMIMYPDYDSAMFLAYLTIVPSMAVFVFSIETNFFERYQRFYEDILNHSPFRKVRQNHQAIVDSIVSSSRNFIVIQGAICFIAVLLAPQIFALLNINYLQIGIFRIGTVAAFFHVMTLFQMIILSYFDSRRITMYIQGFFLLSNTILTIWSMKQGFPYYGYGYLLSSMLTFVLTTVAMFHYVRDLPYHAFITNNNSVRQGG